MKVKRLIVPWIRVVVSSVIYYLLMQCSLMIMTLYRLTHIPAASEHVCGNVIIAKCVSYVSNQLLLSGQWQVFQLFVYISLSLVLFPVFKSAKGRVLLNLSLVSLLVTSFVLLTSEINWQQLIAGFLCPLFLAMMIIYWRKRKVVFNN